MCRDVHNGSGLSSDGGLLTNQKRGHQPNEGYDTHDRLIVEMDRRQEVPPEY